MADDFPGEGFVERVLQLNPFDITKFQRDMVVWKPGLKLADYIDGMTGPEMVVSVNGGVVPPEQYGQLALKPEDQIVLKPVPFGGGGPGGGGTGKMIFRVIAMVAIAVLAVYTGGLAIAAGHAFLGALISGGIMIAGGLIVNAFTPTPHQANTAGSEQPSYGWDGPQMTARQGLKIGVGIGIFRPAPNVIGSWTFERNNQEWMNVLMSLGHGAARAISSVLINDNKAENYRGVVIEKRMGYMEQTSTSQFHRLVNEYPVNVKLTVAGGSYTYTGHRSDTTGLELQFQFPRGLWKGPDSNGNFSSWTVWTRVEWRKVGDPTWNTAVTPRTTTPVTGVPAWVAISTDDVQGGPDNVVVHATSPNVGDHYPGEPFDGTNTFNIYDDLGSLYSTETRAIRGSWHRNPVAPQGINGGIGDGGGGITPIGGGSILQTVQTWSYSDVPVSGPGGHDNAQRVIRHTAFINNLAPAQYEVRVTKIGSGAGSLTHADNNSSDVGEDDYFFSVREVTNDDLTYPGIITMAVKALATDQLSGSGLNVSPLVDFGDPITLGYKHLVAADRPQVYYRFDELSGTVCSDQSGRGNNGAYSATGVTLQQPTLINQSTSKAVAMNGAGTTKITIPALALSSSWAIDCWIKPTTLTGFIAGAAGDPIQVALDATGKLNVIYGGLNHLSSFVLTAGNLYHIAILSEAGWIRYIVNGVSDTATYPNAGNFTCTEVLRGINGVVDEFCIYAPNILRPNFMRRYQWGLSKHNILDDYTGNNPALAVWNLMTNPDYGAGAPDGVSGGIRFDQMDAIAFKKWADYCNQLVSDGRGGLMFRHTTNAFIEADDDLWTVVSKIASASHATVMRTGTTYTVALDAPYDTIKQFFSVANIKEGSYKRSWTGLADRATQLDVVFMDEMDNYKRTPMTVTLDSAIQAGQLLKKGATLELFGVTAQAEAWRMATYKLLQNQKIFSSIEFQADIDAITCTLGDVIKVQHDVPQWGTAGRCVAGGGTRTNLVTRSSDFANAAWTKPANFSVTADTTVAPDGTMTADTLTDNETVASSSIAKNIAVPNDSATYTISFFVKAGTGGVTMVKLALTNGTVPVNAWVALDPATGNFSKSSLGVAPASVQVTPLSNGCFRFAWQITNNSTGNNNIWVERKAGRCSGTCG
jgi:sulfur carrier protein ThiS